MSKKLCDMICRRFDVSRIFFPCSDRMKTLWCDRCRDYDDNHDVSYADRWRPRRFEFNDSQRRK